MCMYVCAHALIHTSLHFDIQLQSRLNHKYGTNEIQFPWLLRAAWMASVTHNYRDGTRQNKQVRPELLN